MSGIASNFPDNKRSGDCSIFYRGGQSQNFIPVLSNQWKQKYGGRDAQYLKGLKALQEENARLKWMFANLSLDDPILKDIIEKKL
ncbi:hypothetical protein KB553_09785 [Chryseobacterium rhizoplanae]|uniref:hypothetical protein n=1 Tax=Chryseobacterium rhizoplanae TaxID=1609531 RepID=UPI001CE2B5DF|nr:hypothetical protein [Chryseobacterium rhizoplanae]UCA62251.1 hypothetical protein KB553_09785 [Chryseobacterium rhizoplanae]